MAYKMDEDVLKGLAQGTAESGNMATDAGSQIGSGGNVQGANAALKPQQNAAINPGNITQSYYTEPVGEWNYTENQPVYAESDAVKNAGQQATDWENERPGEYQSAYNQKIQGLIDSILNRGKFTYDVASDPLYKQYAQQYERNGQNAMKSSIAESALLTGGFDNSYAQQVGQQTYQQYMEQMNNKIPELRDAAYQLWKDQLQGDRDDLGMLQGQDQIDYGRYRDNYGDWQAMLNYYYNKYGDMSDKEYERYKNDLAAWQTDRSYWYQKHRDDVADDQWAAEFNARYGGGGSGGGGGGGGGKKTTKPAATGTDDKLGYTSIAGGPATKVGAFTQTDLNNARTAIQSLGAPAPVSKTPTYTSSTQAAMNLAKQAADNERIYQTIKKAVGK